MSPETMAERLAKAVVAPDLPVAEALARLQDAGTGMLLLESEERRLIGVFTDGDVRRHILEGGALDRPCGEIASRSPVVAPVGMTPEAALHLMDTAREYVINHLPVVTEDGVIAGFWLRSDFVKATPVLSAVIMAGGFGTRLMPLTETTPKPMLRVGDRPLLERTIERLRAAGICDVRVTTHYLGDHIASHFGDGQAFGVRMSYVPEDRPLGTAGALRRLEPSTETLLVMNGDILTGVDFGAMFAYHREQRADATIGVRAYELQVPYGVVECQDSNVTALHEKPVQRCLVNAGIYLLEPAALMHIPDQERFDMTDLIQRLLDQGRSVVSFPIVEYWLDIGRPADYEQAQRDAERMGA
jgi:dTDP-glucose pyrophosphorylase